MMRRLLLLTSCAAMLTGTGGCHMVRQFDQWKCDHFGICMCGVRPSWQQAYPPCPPPTLDPATVVVPPVPGPQTLDTGR